ncbi:MULTISPECIES: tRNA (adenosine(37)-N6)-threonylcarbamoyltransferase complex ATPase subunit type 1 TsaE [Psychrobacter]|jgi:tRNA threonylcarbamoyladenosine biosynthesis protein TsaE|uniref:tRNA (adenosine(37)-N6)-threonylcarbamoyltransferase complex ATPase subunit type 1 TsaE n=1 Tax=Psychrobacter TaxID=497 RepID=UPI00086854F3|nr:MULTISPECIES: tRNA (adenosine(37)-N6)-threonylcarbamoyltransferase complex ATPase subunit type 1 TsaE [Psychrobacter]MBA6243183.1 tRNA (adenosine(37)-N6)-threonylcarbamoyltransferase complex ATPase subunit type 1 TsaE [Psychrobacter sp. Urea-trap-18]MBA6286241.1 tRNA (adenosine(37)-N6)-threonylcarbamoyltransferase complex ATPase subunit type 1 TsaE [Psychrobacter sp. Urea-trap-16]MBA6317390.1 tRNA (adenosine(37)-N6)-threonylcarbamoyltransferase complex ATPase subunit type 1 TsaE [Psychrobacte|tara:strand:- start:45 stop:575 length:531 start_codon:yes stop_codon:yes gene_type:complete
MHTDESIKDDTYSQTLILNSEQDTQSLAQQLADLPLTGSVWLAGDLGAGKTTLTRYWLQALGHIGAVKSPTYTLVEPYSIQKSDGSIKPVYHADLYRLQDPEELSFIGFDEYLDEPNALVIIEWASRADSYLPPPTLFIDMTQSVSDDNDTETRQVQLRLSKAGQAQGLDLSQLSI